jgi:hemoglobin
MMFYDKVLDSEVIGDWFEGVDMRRLIDHQTKFISQVLGGPVAYSDEQLQNLHQPLAITPEAFGEMIRLLRETLEDFEFAREDITSIMADIEGRRHLIVAASS